MNRPISPDGDFFFMYHMDDICIQSFSPLEGCCNHIGGGVD